jgi:SOS-response transcriptional repressor LexA
MTNNWADRIKDRMDTLKLTQESLARKMGVTQSAITHYLTGRRVPPLKQFHNLATVLDVSPAWLQFGITSVDTTSATKQYPVPIISWQQAIELNNGIRPEDAGEFVPHFYVDQSHWYALRVKGDSMVSTTGYSHTFRAGDIIVIDPDRKPAHEDYVIALLPRLKEATFKQYVIDSGMQYLKPLNPQYPLVEMNESMQIHGVVVSCINSFI